MEACKFVCSIPEYVLDRIIIVSEGHEHKVSSYKLAKYSDYFKEKLKEIRSKEIEKLNKGVENVSSTADKPTSTSSKDKDSVSSSRRKRTKSVSDLKIERITLPYKDPVGLEYVLSFIHSQNDLTQPQLEITVNNFVTIIKAGKALNVPDLISHCFKHIKTDMNLTNCWAYFNISSAILSVNKDMYDFIKYFFLEHFLSISDSNSFLLISFLMLKEFLTNDMLNCKEEMLLLPLIEKWIDHDKGKRSKHFTDLFSCLRLGLLKSKEVDTLSLNSYVKQNWNDCINFLTWSQLNNDEINNPNNGLTKNNIQLIKYMKKPRLPREAIIVVGGWEGNQDDPNFGPSRALQIYDNRSNVWKRLTSESFALDEGHAYSGCVALNLKIYVVGGYISSGPTQTLKAFDIEIKKWKYLSPMHEKRNYIAVCSLNNCIYAIGGHNGRTRLNSVEKYDPEQNHWTLVAPMKQVRSDAGCDSLNNKLYVCGGFDGHQFYSNVEMYDSEINQWTTVAPMNSIRSGVSLIAFELHLYAIGGNDGLQRLRSVERYDPEKNKWQDMPTMIRQRSNFCVCRLEKEIYVMGGWSDESNSTISLVEKWSPGWKNEWKPVHQLFMPASANCCCSIKGLNFIRSFFVTK